MFCWILGGCEKNRPCQNGGQCTDIDVNANTYTCTCPLDYKGVNCEHFIGKLFPKLLSMFYRKREREKNIIVFCITLMKFSKNFAENCIACLHRQGYCIN